MTMQQKIRMALAYKRMSEAELARCFGSSPAAFHQRLETCKFTQEELKKIASGMGAEYHSEFKFPDGETIG